jgi:5-methylcytosine-specific restriction protein A
MPSRPPSLNQKPRAKAWASTRKSRHERGYGREHERMREIVLREEPLCRMCLAMSPPRYTPSGIADHIVPKAEGGTDERSNYQALGYPLSRYPNGCDCHDRKTAEEAARARSARPPRHRRMIAPDGWPLD